MRYRPRSERRASPYRERGRPAGPGRLRHPALAAIPAARPGGGRGCSSCSYPAPLTLERMQLPGYGLHAFRIVQHSLMDGLVDGLLQGWAEIRGQLLQNSVRTEVSGFVEEALVKHGLFPGYRLSIGVRVVI